MSLYDDLEANRRTVLEAAGAMGALILGAKAGNQQCQDDLTATQAALDAANARIAELEDQIAAQEAAAANEPPSGYTVPNNVADLFTKVDNQTPCFLPNGDWPLPHELLSPDGTDLALAPDAWLLRTWASGNAVQSALIQTRDLTTSRQSFKLQGGHIGQRIPASGSGLGGGVLSIRADDMVIRDIDMPYWIDGRAFCGGGERPTWDNWSGASAPYDYSLGPDQPAGSGCGGARWMLGGGAAGGGEAKLTRINLTTGDDSLQFVPAGSEDPMFNAPDIHDIAYEDCTVRSYKARPTVVGLQAGNQFTEGTITSGMRSGVHRVAFRRIRGRTSSTPVNVANHHSVGGITDVAFVDVVTDQDGLLGNVGQPYEIYVLRQPAPDGTTKVGEVTRIDLSGVIVNEWTNTRVKPIGPKGYYGTKGLVGTIIPPPPQA